jgi:hypothetical protein
MRDAQKNSTEVVIKEADLEAVSKAASTEVVNAQTKAAAAPTPAPGAPPVPAPAPAPAVPAK